MSTVKSKETQHYQYTCMVRTGNIPSLRRQVLWTRE